MTIIMQGGKKRRKHDFYETPEPLVRAALGLLPVHKQDMVILDPGAGRGVWGRAARNRFPKAEIIGVEPNFSRPKEYNEWWKSDYRFLTNTSQKADWVIGNPPYRLAEEFVRTSLDLLRPGGMLCFLLRLAFLESSKRGNGLWKEFPPSSVHVLMERPSFTENGKTDETAYGIYIWCKGKPVIRPLLYWLHWKKNGDKKD